MAKAITGAVEIAAGIALTAFVPGGATFGWSLISMGVGQEISAIGDALGKQRGMANTIRQAAAPRRVIYGTQRVGAVEVFESTTGGSKDQYNFVLVFAAHEITNYLNLYLDGRQVYWAGSGPGYTTRNGIGFGGGADGVQHIGPDGSDYTFVNAYSGHRGVWVDPRFGDQALGDYFTSLQANDSRWGPDANGNTPSLMGCAALYVKTEYNTDDFPGKPDFKATIKGKAVYDPRTGVTAYSENWALVVADIIQNSDYGLGDVVNTDQLIAAANICDESVSFAGAGGGTEARYTCHYTWTMDRGVGEVLDDLMQGAGGRISYIDGEWHIFPGTYLGPALSFSSANLLAKPTWSAQRKFRDKVNSVQGTYIAPNYPYSAAGDLYDANGWYNGSIQNNFPYAFQPTSYPTFACDTLHGYASDQYLSEDGGVELPMTMDFSSVLSITQAQRLAKIALLRNRQQGSGTLVLGAEGLLLQPNDTFFFSWPQRGWVNKLLEVSRMDCSVAPDSNGVPQISVTLTVNETDPSVYTWLSTDEQTPYAVQAAPTPPGLYTTAPPTGLVLTSSAATALVQPDGTVAPRIEVAWTTPADARVTAIQIQYELVGASGWSDGGTVSAASNVAYIAAVAGQQYNVQIRSLRSSGGSSVWVALSGFTASLLLSTQTDAGVGVGSLVGEAYASGGGAIDCMPFNALYGGTSVPIFPAGSVLITTDGTIGGSAGAIQQQTLYYVYYSDPTFAGGNVTPIATTNRADYEGKLGYFLIDSVVTGYAAPGTGGTGTATRYYPTTYSDIGARSTVNPPQAYDEDLTTYATVSGNATGTYLPPVGGSPADFENTEASGDCIFSGWPGVVPSSSLTLTVVAACTSRTLREATLGTATIVVKINGTPSTMVTYTAAASQSTYNVPVPASTPLNTVQVEVTATPGSAEGTPTNPSSTSTISVQVVEIYIQ